MDKLNENIITLYSKWKEGYVRKENSFELKVRNFLYNRKDAGIFEISKDGNHLNAIDDVKIFEEDILDGKLTVPFGEVKGAFDCSYCSSLTSLEGAPQKVKYFVCHCCGSLLSLVGAPKEVKHDFKFAYCKNLTSLEGAPEKVKGDFNCEYCRKLKSIEDLPKEIGGNLYINKKFKGEIPDDVTIGGKIKYYG